MIPVWNGQPYLAPCLDALLAQTGPDAEIIAVDNASSDGSGAHLAERYPQVRLLTNSSNLGFGGGCNIGMRAAQGEVIILLNQDTVVAPGWLAALLAAFQDPAAGIAGCKIIDPATSTILHAGGYVDFPAALPHHYGQGDRDTGQWDTTKEVEYVTGAALAIRRPVMQRIGMFDERFFPAYYEDVDLCFRAREAGYMVLYWPAAVVMHHESTSTPADRRMFYYQRGRVRFALKHWALEALLHDFPPSEEHFQLAFTLRRNTTRPLRLAYALARIEARDLVAERWPAEAQALPRLSAMLRRLQAHALVTEFEHFTSVTDGEAASDTASAGGAASAAADATASGGDSAAGRPLVTLREFEFTSRSPLAGRLLSLLRRAWFSVAAKWAIRDLIQQQDQINQLVSQQLQHLQRLQPYWLEATLESEEEALFGPLLPQRWDLVAGLTSEDQAAVEAPAAGAHQK